MLRTNSKKVKETVKAYLMENFKEYYSENERYIGTEYSDLKPIDINNYSEVCDDILRVFYDEEIHHNLLFERRQKSLYDCFRGWCAGLCSPIDTSYFYNVSAVNLLGGWLEQTEEERNKYTESQAEDRITQLLFREIMEHATITPSNLLAAGWYGRELNK